MGKQIGAPRKMAITIRKEVTNQLERAQEHRTLSVAVISLLKVLKARILGLAAI
jgi:hypothetical protein